MKKQTSLYVAIIAGTFASSFALSAPLQPIPKESGVGGSVVVGVSAASYSSNMIAGPDGDLGTKTIDSLNNGPDSETNVAPIFTGEINYTFGQSRTQIFLGSALEDLVRYDLAFQAGVRQELQDKGIVYGGFLFSAIPTEVYADPYVTNSARPETDRDSTGLRVGWQDIMGSNFGVELSHREIELDDENSGDDLVSQSLITAQEQRLLSREGDHSSVTLSYKHVITKGHLLVPEINYHDFDLDGGAMARDRYGLNVAYFWTTPKFSLITTFFYAREEHDELNPIYTNISSEEEVDVVGASIVGTYNNIFDVKNLSALVSVAAGESDSNINFYDADVVSGTLGVVYRF